MYDKVLLSKVPLSWTFGFHEVKGMYPPSQEKNLMMIHLHRIDYEEMVKRHHYRATQCRLKDDGENGVQHRIGDRVGVLNYLNKIASPLETIPQMHKQCLSHL
jgi:hypothetical protein